MTCNEFYSLMKNEFIKDRNCLIIEHIQRISSPPFYGTYGTGDVAFCEVIVPDGERRNIIRFIGNIIGDDIRPRIKIEVISIILSSPGYPNLPGYFDARRYIVFNGPMEDKNNPAELNTEFLMTILGNYYAFMK